MSETTKIQWCHHTFNPWIGCAKVSPGCAHCYAEVDTPARIARKTGLELWGKDAGRKIKAESGWSEPLRWDRAAAKAGERRRVFCASQSDVFEDNDQVVEARERLWDTIYDTPNLDWLLLTKRPENFDHMILWCHDHAGEYRERYWSNVWLGVSVEDQKRADERIPLLVDTPAAVRFLSVEPLLEPITFTSLEGIDWVIVGGESGDKARPCHLDWFRSIVKQCKDAHVFVFVKQLGSNHWCDRVETGTQSRVPLEDPKGGDPSEWPEDLQVREFPR